jgi:hypothetical protein
MSELPNVRILPMPVVHPVWRDEGGYPDAVQVSFANGHVRTYIDVRQPRPQVISTRELQKMMKDNPDGYRPKHAKK